jgi:YD repeat-containing protein
VFRHRWLLLLALAFVVVLVGCAPGNERWASVDNPANFWAGLWHGLIIVVTFIVSLFTRDVNIYEVNNIGWGYNLGFIIGVMVSLGGGARASARRRKHREPDWDSIGSRIADSVRDGVRSSFTDTETDWDEFGRRIEERIRAELRTRGRD